MMWYAMVKLHKYDVNKAGQSSVDTRKVGKVEVPLRYVWKFKAAHVTRVCRPVSLLILHLDNEPDIARGKRQFCTEYFL
jgi:hypothetical protein